ncbi:RNA polymerase sigma factor [Sphingobacterium sp. JB170]|uniref:RNA polymerase sigma factor n=1 Tax=Sphingobacterium sp. JB170 TaxID=1434842 RepID=UPI001C4FB922|nr:sigma-70 family RNA polymerase sigma factor [Sphingobacterium sp. JB170]
MHWHNFIAGDNNAYRELYNENIDKLYSYGSKFSKDTDLVKDCIHDLFVDLNNYRAKLHKDVNVTAYLYLSLRRKIFSCIKKKGTSIEVHNLEQSIFAVEWNAEINMVYSEEWKLLLSRLNEELKILSSRQQEVLFLKFHSELTYEEVAEIMRISVATCRTLVYRAIKQLRVKMENVPKIALFLSIIFS